MEIISIEIFDNFSGSHPEQAKFDEGEKTETLTIF
jgi:hypothetical protein